MCRKVYREISLLPFMLNDFRCLSIAGLRRLETDFNDVRRNALRYLKVDIQLGITQECSKILGNDYSHVFPNLRGIAVLDALSSIFRHSPCVVESSMKKLEKHFRRGRKQDLEIVFTRDTSTG